MDPKEFPPNSSTTQASPPGGGLLPVRFSLKWLLVVVTVAAVFLVLSVVADRFLLAWVLEPLLTLVLPTLLLVSAIFGRGDVRAFSVGALVPCYRVVSSGRAPVWSVGLWLGDTVWLLVWCVLCGAVAVAVYRRIARQG